MVLLTIDNGWFGILVDDNARTCLLDMVTYSPHLVNFLSFLR